MNPIEVMRRPVRSVAALVALAFAASPGRAAASIAGQTLGAGLSLMLSYQIKNVVEAASSGSSERAIASGILFAALGGAVWINQTCYVQILPRMMEALTVHLDAELIRLTTRIPTLDYADRPLHADKIALIRDSSRQLVGGLEAVVANLRSAVMLGGTFLILIGIDPWLALLPFFAIPRALAGQRARRLAVRAQETSAEPLRLRGHLFDQATSPVAGKELRIFGLGDELARRFLEITRLSRRLNVGALWAGAFWATSGDLAFTVGCVGAVAWVVVRAASGAVSPGGVVLAATLTMGLVIQMTAAQEYAQYLQAIMTTAERYLWLVDVSKAATDVRSAGGPPPARLDRRIRIEAVSFHYPDRDTPVLTDISLELPAGRVIALVGENGSGKSTLIKLLCGFYRPSAGRILIDDTDLAEIDLPGWRRRIGGAFQDFTNLEVVLHESVGLGEIERLGRRDLAHAALQRAGAADLARLAPAGLDTMLGKRWGGTELSGGQWQKLALGRALIRERPLLVVFDEPAAALDASAEHDMFVRFAAEARSAESAGRATLLVSHRFSTVRMADAIAVLHGGRIVEFGSHEALLAAGAKYAELFELQAKAYR
jgi:ATP-binding cassette subfamily B protein